MKSTMLVSALALTLALPALAQTTQPAQRAPGAQTEQRAPGAAAPATRSDLDRLLDAKLKNQQNETIGDVNAIRVDQGGRPVELIVGVGGFLGIGEREVAVPFNQVQVAGDQVTANLTKEQLRQMPEYKYPDSSYKGKAFSDSGVYQTSGTPRSTAANTAPATVGAAGAGAGASTAGASAAAGRDTARPAASTGRTASFNATGEMSGDAIIGATVRNAQNENVGEVQDIFIDNNGQIKTVIVSVGGFLGMGSRDVAMNWSDLKPQRDADNLILATTATKDSLRNMPEYKSSNAAAAAPAPPCAGSSGSGASGGAGAPPAGGASGGGNAPAR